MLIERFACLPEAMFTTITARHIYASTSLQISMRQYAPYCRRHAVHHAIV